MRRLRVGLIGAGLAFASVVGLAQTRAFGPEVTAALTALGYVTNTSTIVQYSKNVLYPSAGYLNFGTLSGASGYGVRANAGTIQFKNLNGDWVQVVGSSVTAAAVMTDNCVVRGDGGERGIQTSAVCIDDAGAVSGVTTLTAATVTTTYAGGLKLFDSDGSNTVQIRALSNLVSNIRLDLVMAATRQLTINGDPTIDDWFDQGVKTSSSPTFNVATVTGLTCTGCIGASQIAATTVTGSSYGSSTAIASFTVDADGRLTAAANVTPQLTLTSTYFSSLSAANLTGIPAAGITGTLGGGFGGTGNATFTKGDLLVASGTTTLIKLGVGANGTSLIADSGETSGIRWGTVSATTTVTAAAVFLNDNRLIRSDGATRGVQASGITVSDGDDLSGIIGLSAEMLSVDTLTAGTPAHIGIGFTRSGGLVTALTVSGNSDGFISGSDVGDGVALAFNATPADGSAQIARIGAVWTAVENGTNNGIGLLRFQVMNAGAYSTRLEISQTTSTFTGIVAATTFSGSGASLTAVPTGQLSGTVASSFLAGLLTNETGTAFSVFSDSPVLTTLTYLTGTSPAHIWTETDQAANHTKWTAMASGDAWSLQAIDDVNAAQWTGLSISRATVAIGAGTTSGYTLLGNIAAGTGVFTGRALVIGRNSSGSGAAGCLGFRPAASDTAKYLWLDATGAMRIHTACPTENGSTVSDTAGSVLGGTNTTATTFSAGDYTGSGTVTWTVAVGDVTLNSWRQFGDTMFVSANVITTTVAGTGNVLRLTIPNSKTAAESVSGPCLAGDNSATYAPALCRVVSGNTYIEILKYDASNWTASTDTTRVAFQLSFKVS